MKFNDNGEIVDLEYSITKDAYYNPETGIYVDKYGNPIKDKPHGSEVDQSKGSGSTYS